MSMSILELGAGPERRRTVLAAVWRRRPVLAVMARTDLQVRYKRAAFGIVWAVAVPLFQALVLVLVFSRVVVFQQEHYALYVLSGILAWSYFSSTISVGTTSVVDGSELTDKVWFPRAMLPLVPCLSGLVGLAVTMTALIAAMPILGRTPDFRVLILLPACLLLVTFTASLSLVLAALHVYFRDVRHIVQAAMLVWFYATPIVYPLGLLGRLRPVLEFNPLTGIASLMRLAVVGSADGLWRPLMVSVAATIALTIIAIEAYRRHDRVFADLL